jgi:hypothetical protein
MALPAPVEGGQGQFRRAPPGPGRGGIAASFDIGIKGIFNLGFIGNVLSFLFHRHRILPPLRAPVRRRGLSKSPRRPRVRQGGGAFVV